MLANDIEKRRIGKALFVRADNLRCINSCQDCRLAGSALRSALNTETGIGGHNDAGKWNLRSFVLKDCERSRTAQSVERIVRTACADAETIDKKEQDARIIFHCLGHRAVRARDSH